MQCERLLKMVKLWYTHVREETMAPARMVAFMEQHAETCDICLQDSDLKEEIAKITELVLPESKIPKAIRQKHEKAAALEKVTEEESQQSDGQKTDNEELNQEDVPELTADTPDNVTPDP